MRVWFSRSTVRSITTSATTTSKMVIKRSAGRTETTWGLMTYLIKSLTARSTAKIYLCTTTSALLGSPRKKGVLEAATSGTNKKTSFLPSEAKTSGLFAKVQTQRDRTGNNPGAKRTQFSTPPNTILRNSKGVLATPALENFRTPVEAGIWACQTSLYTTHRHLTQIRCLLASPTLKFEEV